MIEERFAPPVLTSSIKQLYKSGVLKVYCVVLRFKRFDTTTVKQVRSTEKSPKITSGPSSRSSEWFLLCHVSAVADVYKVVNSQATGGIGGGVRVRARNRD